MKISRKFVKEYVSSFYVFGGQIDKDDIVDGSYTIVDTMLTAKGVQAIKEGTFEHPSFKIFLEGGAGWGIAYPYKAERGRGKNEALEKRNN